MSTEERVAELDSTLLLLNTRVEEVESNIEKMEASIQSGGRKTETVEEVGGVGWGRTQARVALLID